MSIQPVDFAADFRASGGWHAAVLHIAARCAACTQQALDAGIFGVLDHVSGGEIFQGRTGSTSSGSG